MLMDNRKPKPVVLYEGDEDTQQDMMANFKLRDIYRRANNR